MRRYVLLPLLVLTIVSGTIFIACGDDDDDDGGGTAQAAETASSGAGSATSMMAALSYIDGAGFHGIDETLNKPGGQIDASWQGKTRKALVAAKAIEWPADLRGDAQAFSDAAGRLLAALGNDDAAGAAAPATDAHKTQHDLSNKAWEMLGKQAGVESGAGH